MPNLSRLSHYAGLPCVFSEGTLEYGANSTTAWDSTPTPPPVSTQPEYEYVNHAPALSLKICPSYPRLNAASFSSSLKAIYARDGTFSLFNLLQPRSQRRHTHSSTRTPYFLRNFPGQYIFHTAVSSVTHDCTLFQNISSGRLGGRRRTTVFRRSFC